MKTKKTLKNLWSIGRMLGVVRHQLSIWGTAAFAAWLVFAPVVVWADIAGTDIDPIPPGPGYINHIIGGDYFTYTIWDNRATLGGTNTGNLGAGGTHTWDAYTPFATFTPDPTFTWNGGSLTVDPDCIGTFHIGNMFRGNSNTFLINASSLSVFGYPTGTGNTYSTFQFNNSTLDIIGPGASLSLTTVGRMMMVQSILNINSGTLNLGTGNLYLWQSNVTLENAAINSSGGEVIFSGGGGGTGYRNFVISGSITGSADLRFTEIVDWGSTYYIPGFDNRSPILVHDNRTIIYTANGASISNPNIYLDGTHGRDAHWLQQQGLIPLQNQTDAPRRNNNLLYNIVRVDGEGTYLTITSNVHIARIDTELLLDEIPPDIDPARPGSITSDYAAIVHSPRIVVPTASPPGRIAIANPNYQGAGYDPRLDPTNNPDSLLYKYREGFPDSGVYNPMYDPTHPCHNDPNDPLRATHYNSTFDRSHPSYNPASDLTHVAYNPYVDANGYSGGWTKVDTGTLFLTGNGTTTGVMDRDINSLIDVQGGTLRFTDQWSIGRSQDDSFNRTGAGIFQANPNGTLLANGQVDQTNYYTIQLNALSNPTLNQPPTTTNRLATTLYTTNGGYWPAFVAHSLPAHNPTDINNRIILHGGGNIQVGDWGSRHSDPSMAYGGAYVADDDYYRNYSGVVHHLQGGGVGNYNGYLRLSVMDLTGGNTNPAIRNGATLVGIRPSQGVAPFLNKTGVGVLDLTGVTWEYEEGLTAIELNVFNGTLAFTDQKDLGAGVISLSGRDAKLAVLTNSLMDPLHGQIVTGATTNNGASRDLMIDNIIRLVNGGTINVVQGGKELANPAVPNYELPFYSQTDITKTRQNDGYTNQQNLILNMEQVIVDGSGVLRKIGLGKLTLENVLTIPEWTTLSLEIQRGTLSFSNPNSLGNGAILFTLDKNATLQYRGTDPVVTVNNNIYINYDSVAYNSGGATFDIRHANDPSFATTMKLTGIISGDRNFLTITKLGDLKSTLDMTEATMSSGAGAASWDIRTGTLAFDLQSNIGTGDMAFSEATTLHKVYLPITPTQTHTYAPVETITNNVIFRNNGTLIVDDGASLTLTGQLSVGRQMDKLGGGTLILNGAIAKTGLADVGNVIHGGLRIKEGSLSFSRKEQIVSSETGKPAVSINLYGDKTSLIYTGSGDIDQSTQKPRPMEIVNNINLLPSLADLQAATVDPKRAGIIDVTNVTGNLQIDGANIRGGDLTLNDLLRDADGNPTIINDKWQTVIYNITGDSQLIKRGAGTLTLTGTLNGSADENISLIVERGNIAFSQQVNLGNNKIILDGTGAGLEYVGVANNFTITNTIELYNGGGRFSVLDAAATWKLVDGKIIAVRENADGTIYSGTWTIGKGGEGTLDLTGMVPGTGTGMDFTQPLVLGSTNPNDKLSRLEIDNGSVRFEEAKNLGSAVISMGAPKLLTTGQTSYTSGILEYIGAGQLITNTISLHGGAVLSSAGQPVYDTVTKRAVVAGGGVNVAGGANIVLTLNGAISGAGNFVKTGTGTLKLSGVNTFTGDLIVEAGRLDIAAQQQIRGDLIVKHGTAAATAANVLAGKAVYLASGTIFDMSTEGANQTLAGIFKYAIAGGSKTQVWVSTPTGVNVNPDGTTTPYNCTTAHGISNPTPTSLDGNTLTLVQTANTRSVIDVLYGNKGAHLVVDRGYLTVDLDHFHGKADTSNGGTIINIGKTGGEQGNVEVTYSSNDVGTWNSENVKLTGGHITVGHNPALSGDKSWQSANVELYDASTIDIAKDWLSSINNRTAVEPINVLIDSGSRISVGENWVQSGNVVIDNSTLYVGGQWSNDNNPNGMWDPTLNNGNGGYIYDEGGSNNLQWTMGYGDFDARDFVQANTPSSTVTIRNDGVAKVGGNWTSGAVILDNGTLNVGHMSDPVNLVLAANTGKFETSSERVWIKNSNATILGDWESGDVLIEGNSHVSVGIWNGLRPIGMGNMDIVGDFEIKGTPNSSFRTAGNVDANSFNVTNSRSTIIGGGLTVSENIDVTGSMLGIGGKVTSQNLILDTTTATIGSGTNDDVAVGNAENHGTTFFTTSNVTMSGNFATDTLLISNTAAQFGKNVTVDGAARIYGVTVGVTGDWHSGIHANTLNPDVKLQNDVMLEATNFDVRGHFSANDDAVTATGSTITVGKNWNSGITSLTNTATSVTGNFSSGPLTITGFTTSPVIDNLFVGGSLGVDGQVIINSASSGTSVHVKGDWTSDNVYANGSNANMIVEQNWTSGAIDTKGGSFKIGNNFSGGNMTTGGASIKSTDATWDVKGNWESGNVTMKNGYADVGGDFTLRDIISNKDYDIKLTDVTSMAVSGNWKSGVVSSTFSLENRQSVFKVGGSWESGQFTANGDSKGVSNIGLFSIGGGDAINPGNAKFNGNVSTTAMNWDIFGDVDATGRSVNISAASYINTKSWESGAASITNVGSVKTTGIKTIDQDNGYWKSDSLRLDASSMTMTIGGDFNPGSKLSLGMQQGISLNSLIPVYDINVGGDANLGGVKLSVTGAQNLFANGRYLVSRISVAGTLDTNGLSVSDLSLFKKVELDYKKVVELGQTTSRLDVYVRSNGFAAYAARMAEFGMGKLSHNQLQVVNSLARIEQNITDFEIATQGDNFTTNAVTMSPMRKNAVVQDVLSKLVAHGDDETIAVSTRVANINRALTQLSAETYANSMFLAAPRPWMSALDRTRLDNSMYFAGNDYASDMQAIRGQVRSLAKMNRVWITPEYSFDSLSSDGNARTANIGRLGFSMGIDRRVRHNATAGVLFGFNNARLSQDEDRFQAGDFQIGAYASAMVGYYIELRGFMGCGWQNYESNRIVDMTFTPGGTRAAAAGRANGQSFSGTLEAARPLFFGMFILKPTAAMDFSSYARDAFTETGDTVRVNVGRTTYTRVAPRLGATWETDPMRRLAATTRFFGGYNFGDDHVVTRTQFASISGDRSIHSTLIGRGFIDAGLGARYHANQARTMSFHGNLDIMAAKRSLSGAVSIGAAWMY